MTGLSSARVTVCLGDLLRGLDIAGQDGGHQLAVDS
jgi:hypothetical protein